MSPPLVLLHGWGMHAGVWSGVQADLQALGEVLAIDLPGYGEAPLLEVASLDHMAQAILLQSPVKFDLCAWSLGGLVAQRIAVLAPQRLRRLVLIGSTPCFTVREDWICGIPAKHLQQFADDLVENYEATLKRFLALQVRGDISAKNTLSVLRQQLFSKGRPSVRVLQQGLAVLMNTDLRCFAHNIQQPVLLVQGTHDQLTPLCAVEWMVQHLQQAKLHVVESAGHAVFLSHQAECVTAISGFLYGNKQ